MSNQWKLVPVEPTQSILDAMTTERKKGNGVLQMWFEAMAASPTPPVEAEGMDFGIDGRSVRVSQEAYSIFLAREAAGREKIAALQQRLTAADERADHLEAGIKWETERNALLLASLTDAEDMLSVTSLEAGQRIEVLEGLLREWIGPGVRSVSHMLSLQTRTNAALKPSEGGSDEAMSFAQIAQFNDDNDHCPEREE